ncbi:restriction endonuclease subunit S [Mitsuokella jalaludinii]|uniref:restriction endonuclease subunit S n=1 Tax=Mitsuokella jalaludinii TaxID=187979 RepID=UPI00241DF67B|nr:restriction endonuclease subunit S [Mitsuokella jalaludinii]
MAKNKKEMTPEERLAAALVPEEEQPYELPKGWKWVRIGKIFIDVTDSQKKIKQKEYLLKGKWPVIDQGQHFIGGYSDADELIYTDELPVIIFGDHTRNVKYIDFQFIQGADGVKVLKPQSFIYSKFLFWLLKGTPFPSLGYRRHFPVLKKMVAPLPPLDEQQRLVARIESLFAKLDAAKAKVQTVLDAHETRKATLLHDAFAGKLTAKWREARGVTGDVYQSMPLADVCKSIFDGDHMPPPKSSRGIPFLVISNVNKGKLDFSETRFVPQDYYDKLTDTRKPESGDVLYTLVGTYGIPVLVDTDQAFCFQRHMALLKPKEDVILQRYLWYALQEKDFYREATRIAKGTAQLTVPIKGLRQLTIPMASLPEQQEIVAVLDRLLGREEEVRQSAESVLAAIDGMKQSILARAFRGELGA